MDGGGPPAGRRTAGSRTGRRLGARYAARAAHRGGGAQGAWRPEGLRRTCRVPARPPAASTWGTPPGSTGWSSHDPSSIAPSWAAA